MDTPPKITRGEIVSALALLLAGASVVWTGGVMAGRVDDTAKRVTALEGVMTTQVPIVAGIQTDVRWLRDTAQESRDRETRRSGK